MSFEELWGIGESVEEKEDVDTNVDTKIDAERVDTPDKEQNLEKTCMYCFEEFTPKRSNQKYCNPTCRVRAARKRKTARDKRKK